MPDQTPPSDANSGNKVDGTEHVSAASPIRPPAQQPDEEFRTVPASRSAAVREEDLRHLQLLSIFHFVVGAMALLCGTFPLIYVVLGVSMVAGQFGGGKGPPPPPAMGWMFVVMGGAFMLAGYALGIGLMVAGWLLRRHKGYVFCLVVAGLACMFQPVGIILGVFTIIVLLRPSVKALFGRSTATAG